MFQIFACIILDVRVNGLDSSIFTPGYDHFYFIGMWIFVGLFIVSAFVHFKYLDKEEIKSVSITTT